MPRLLTHQRVNFVFDKCDAPKKVRIGTIEISGISSTWTLLEHRLGEYREAIVEMLGELPDGFHAPYHEGWSVGRMIIDNRGLVWTTDMATVEKLCVLGIASKLGNFCAPRDKWHLLPYKLPYIVFHLPGMVQ